MSATSASGGKRNDRSPPAEAGASKAGGSGASKIACKRCRSLKARCPGILPGSDRCSKCIKAGSACVVEQHKRGRKVGTRLSDPAKALMRMKSAFDIILNQTGKAPELAIPEELSAMLTSSRGSGATSYTFPPPTGGPSATSSISPQADFATPSTYSVGRVTSTTFTDGLPPSAIPLPAYHHSPPTTSPIGQLSYPSTPGGSTGSTFSPLFPSNTPSASEHFYAAPPPPLPPFPSQFKDLGPSSRSSPSLARLFALKSIDEDHPSGSARQLDLYRQDPVHLGYLTEDASRALFELFHQSVNPRICMFDEVLHTHDYVRHSSQLLFFTILAVALKFTPHHPEPLARTRCLALARDQVLRIVSDDGSRTVESVQALLLMVEYKEPTDESAYLYLGMACRLAMDLDLASPYPLPSSSSHAPFFDSNEAEERQSRNRYRALLNCFNADHRFAGCGQNFSKPTMMPEDLSAVRNAATFHRHELATAYDARLVAAVHLRRLLARYDALLKANKEREGGGGGGEDGEGGQSVPLFNLRELWAAVEGELAEWRAFWTVEIRTANPDAYVLQLVLNHEHGTLQIAHHWLFQAFRFPNLPWIHSAEDWEAERRAALAACLGGACRILRLMVTVPNSSLAYSPDTTHLFFSYATFLLAKLFRARLLEIELFDPASIATIFQVIREAAEKLEGATLDPAHTIALHAGLLRSILNDYGPRSSSLPSVDSDVEDPALFPESSGDVEPEDGFGRQDPAGLFGEVPVRSEQDDDDDVPSPFLSRPSTPQPPREVDQPAAIVLFDGFDDGGWHDGWLEEAMRGSSVDTSVLSELFDFRT